MNGLSQDVKVHNFASFLKAGLCISIYTLRSSQVWPHLLPSPALGCRKHPPGLCVKCLASREQWLIQSHLVLHQKKLCIPRTCDSGTNVIFEAQPYLAPNLLSLFFIYISSSQCVIHMPLTVSKTLLSGLRGQNYFPNNTRMPFAILTVLIFTLLVQKQWWVSLLVPQCKSRECHQIVQQWFYSFITTQLQSKLPASLRNILDEAGRMINFIKAWPLRTWNWKNA